MRTTAATAFAMTKDGTKYGLIKLKCEFVSKLNFYFSSSHDLHEASLSGHCAPHEQVSLIIAL